MLERMQLIAGACPDCPTATEVSQIVVETGFWSNLALLSLPVVLLVIVAAGLHRAL